MEKPRAVMVAGPTWADVEERHLAAIRELDVRLQRAPNSIDLLCERAEVRLVWARERLRRGGDSEPLYRVAQADADSAVACAAASTADARAARLLRARVRAEAGELRARSGADAADAYCLAVADCDAVLEADPADIEALLTRARLRLAWGEAAQARAADSRWLFRRVAADCSEALSRGGATAIDARRASANDARGASANDARGAASLNGCGSPENDARAAASIHAPGTASIDAPAPTAIEALLLRGRAFERWSRESLPGPAPAALLAEAVRDFGSVLAMDGRRVEALALRGCCHARSSRWGEATADFARAEQIDPAAVAPFAVAMHDARERWLDASGKRASGTFVSCVCGRRERLPDRATGRLPRCPGCGSILGVPESVRRIADQSRLIQRLGVAPVPCALEDGVHAERGWEASPRLYLTRERPDPATRSSGWIVAGSEGACEPDPEGFERVTAGEVLRLRPEIGAVLALPAGMSAVVEAGRVIRLRNAAGRELNVECCAMGPSVKSV